MVGASEKFICSCTVSVSIGLNPRMLIMKKNYRNTFYNTYFLQQTALVERFFCICGSNLTPFAGVLEGILCSLALNLLLFMVRDIHQKFFFENTCLIGSCLSQSLEVNNGIKVASEKHSAIIYSTIQSSKSLVRILK